MSYSLFNFDNIVDAQNFNASTSAAFVNTLFSSPTKQLYRKVFLTNNDSTNTIYVNFSVNGSANVSSTKWAIVLTPGDSVPIDAGRGVIAQMNVIASGGTPALNMVFGA